MGEVVASTMSERSGKDIGGLERERERGVVEWGNWGGRTDISRTCGILRGLGGRLSC